jgi:hypothetical protein
MNTFLDWVQQHAVSLGLMGSFIVGLFPLYQYLSTKHTENKNNEFSNYHRLVGDLVDPATPRLDRQIAVVYELRNFKNYFSVSIRILEGVKTSWSRTPTTPDLPRIIKEIDLAVLFMKQELGNSLEE